MGRRTKKNTKNSQLIHSFLILDIFDLVRSYIQVYSISGLGVVRTRYP